MKSIDFIEKSSVEVLSLLNKRLKEKLEEEN
jgi:hypothetical protein